MRELYIGLMSGTSADGIDAVLVDFSKTPLTMIDTYYAPYSSTLREKIHALSSKGDNEIERMGTLDVILGKEFAKAANHLLEKNHLSIEDIKAIGSHGQTIRHFPRDPHPFTLQIGDPNVISAETGITTIADFRRKDMAFGGQGAPLVPAFHEAVLRSSETDRVIVNIGGIANVTILPKDISKPIIGFDTGPGNVLLDSWISQHQQKSHDEQGAWAASGSCHENLLRLLLSDSYFRTKPPKSSGREYFNSAWLATYAQQLGKNISPTDVQTTLAELTAQTIIQQIRPFMTQGEIFICGGGAHNQFLLSRLRALADVDFTVASTEKLGIHPDWMEAIAFAWLARQTLLQQAGNVPSVTGAKKAAVLGGVYY